MANNSREAACAPAGEDVASNESTNCDVVAAAQAILDQGQRLLGTLTDDAYRCRCELAFNASIGGHYRHCLDHFECFLAGLGSGVVNYDERKRDPRVESDRSFAMLATAKARKGLEKVKSETLSRHLDVRCEVGYGMGRIARTQSSVAREMIYVIAHAIHHYALIAVIARSRDFALPENFGIAPSTVTYHASQTAGSPVGA